MSFLLKFLLYLFLFYFVYLAVKFVGMVYKQYKAKDNRNDVVKGSAKSKLNISKKDIIDAEFEDLKEYPILSGICSKNGKKVLDDYMYRMGYKLKHEWNPKIRPVKGIVTRDYYFARAYEYPKSYRGQPINEKEK